jgi:hypothetical protein
MYDCDDTPRRSEGHDLRLAVKFSSQNESNYVVIQISINSVGDINQRMTRTYKYHKVLHIYGTWDNT